MPYLIGAFGACSNTLSKKLSAIASNLCQDSPHALQTISFENGVLFAGYKTDEQYQYDRIIPVADQGMLVGKVFDRNQYHPAQFSSDTAQSLINNPKNICSSFWGRYVGALYHKNTKAITLVRDPQGLCAIFYAVRPDGIIFSTELALLYQVLENKPLIDINYFAQHLLHTNHSLASTPFEGVSELLPGMSITVQNNGAVSYEQLWDIASLKSSPITNNDLVEEELLATLRNCTKAWVQDAPGVCVELSGGTDSSSVMILLRDVLPADKKLMAVNYIDSQTASSNEIEHAREVADACGAPLHFLDWQSTSLLDPLPQDFLPNRPSTLLLFHRLREQLHGLSVQNGCPELMNGQGGDHVFLAPQPKLAVADYWLERGLRGITTPLKELSGIYRSPWLPLIRENIAATTSYYRKKRYTEKSETPHLNKNFMQAITKQECYQNDILRKMYPAKATHIESLHHAVSYSERNQYFPNMCATHPLLSQPIVEFGLKIPTYQSFYDGYDRIFFRRAVSRIKRTNSIWRRIKGGTTGSMVKECAHHAQDIRDIILSGKLAASGMLDTQWLEQQTVKMQHGSVDNLWPVLHMLTGQLWLNQWHL